MCRGRGQTPNTDRHLIVALRSRAKQGQTIKPLGHNLVQRRNDRRRVGHIGLGLARIKCEPRNGKFCLNHRHGDRHGRVQVDRQRLQVLSLLALYFFMGGIAGAFGFNGLGYIATLPLALLLVGLALVPAVDDLRSGWRRFRRARQG